MKLDILDKEVPVIVSKKMNKNTYIRVGKDMNIYVTTNIFISEREIKKILDRNKSSIEKMYQKRVKENVKSSDFYFLGQKYDIIMMPRMKGIEVYKDKIFTENKDLLDKWYKKETMKTFSERLEYNYKLFKENIPFPKLRVRKMSTRWGVCNTKTYVVTLNSLLMKEDLEKIDYVIIHELAHLVHPNHSKLFWGVVSKYCPNYKMIRKELKE